MYAKDLSFYDMILRSRVILYTAPWALQPRPPPGHHKSDRVKMGVLQNFTFAHPSGARRGAPGQNGEQARRKLHSLNKTRLISKLCTSEISCAFYRR